MEAGNETGKKKLVINAAVCDMRGATEEKLANYGSVTVNAATVITSPATQGLLARHEVALTAADSIEVPDGEDVQAAMQNGSFTIGASSVSPAQRTILIVNGRLVVEPGAEKSLEGYVKIVVNGAVLCPESVAGALSSRLSVNGSMTTYPDDAVLLKRTFVVDGTFLLRAKPALYYAERCVVMLDPAIDARALSEKGVRFKTQTALIGERLAEAAVPMFSDTTDIRILPDGCAFVDGGATLGDALLKRCGMKLYVNGDLTVDHDASKALEKLEYLVVSGEVRLPKALLDAFSAVRAEYKSIKVVRGRQICDKTTVRIDRALLERNPDGIDVSDCAIVKLTPDIPPELIEERLTFSDCAQIKCTEEQESAVAMVATDVAQIGGVEEEGDIPGVGSIGNLIKGTLGLGDTKVINSVSYRF